MSQTKSSRPTSPGLADNRPLSPHLSVYRFAPTMAMSILHRITGAGLYVGTVLVAWWFMAIAAGPEAYETASWFFGSWIGLIILFGYSWALMHHLLGGMRHFLWDFGYGLEKTFATKLAWFTIIGSAALTALIWIIGLMVW